jgi:hypothetical protein
VNSRKLKKDLGNYTENPDQYIQAFREVSLERCNAIAISDPNFPGETSVLDQAVTAGDDYHLDQSNPTGLSWTGPPQEEEGEGEERQRYWIAKREPQFTIPTGDQAVPDTI